MKSASSLFEELRVQFEALKPRPDQIYSIHNNIRRLTNQFDGPGPDMERVENFNVNIDDLQIPVRLYVPFGASSQPGPTLIYLHGGGFVTCSVESHDGLCRRVASGSNFRVLSVEYRLAPQFPFPAGLVDCETVLKWAVEGLGADYGIDPHRLALGGDSAGGNMTAYLVQTYRDKLKAQVLFYPLMQLENFKPPNPGPQDILQLGVMALKFIDTHYVKDADPKDTRLSPLFETNLTRIPPTYLLTCALDPLRDEGKDYALKLKAAEVVVEDYHEKALPHGFLNFARAFPKAKTIPLDVADFLKNHLI